MDANQSSSKQAIDISEAVWDQNLLEYGSSVESAKDDRLTTDQDELAREIDGRSHAQSEAEASQLSSGTPSSPDHAHTVGCLSPDMPDHESEENSQNIAGVAMGARETGQLYADQVRFGASRGHGFAAEQGNHLWDKLHGYDAKIVGDDNLLNRSNPLFLSRSFHNHRVIFNFFHLRSENEVNTLFAQTAVEHLSVRRLS